MFTHEIRDLGAYLRCGVAPQSEAGAQTQPNKAVLGKPQMARSSAAGIMIPFGAAKVGDAIPGSHTNWAHRLVKVVFGGSLFVTFLRCSSSRSGSGEVLGALGLSAQAAVLRELRGNWELTMK